MRTYNIVCPSCKGTGQIQDSMTVNECPACHGSKVVMCSDDGDKRNPIYFTTNPNTGDWIRDEYNRPKVFTDNDLINKGLL